MEEDNLFEETVQPSVWRTVGVYIIDTFILPLVASLIVYALWLILGLPDFSYLWLILFVLLSVIISTAAKNKWGTTPGSKLFRCRPSSKQTEMVRTIVLGIVFIFWLATKLFLPSNATIENDYFQVDVPKEWHAEHLRDKEPLFHVFGVGKTPNDCALFFTINYNTTGIPLENLVNMTIGGMNRANISDMTVEESTFKGRPATRIRGTLQGYKVNIIVFYGPSGVFSCVMSQNLTDQELNNIIQGTKLKDTKASFVDFDTIWKYYMGDTYESNINQQLDEGMILEGWSYDRNNNSLTMKFMFDASSDDIKSFFGNPDNEEAFINNIKENHVMVSIAENYGKKVSIDLKDKTGIVAYTINSK